MKKSNLLKLKRVVIVFAMAFLIFGALFISTAFLDDCFNFETTPPISQPPLVPPPAGSPFERPVSAQPNPSAVRPSINSSPDNQGEFTDGLRVYFIDVGQGDAALIILPTGETVLVDAGRHNLTNTRFRQDIRSFFPQGGRMVFDWFITTHSHADHIGSADYIVNNSYIRNIIRPITFHADEIYYRAYHYFDIASRQGTNNHTGPIVHSTATFLRFINAMVDSTWYNDVNTNIYIPYAGKTFSVGDAVFTFYSPTTYNYSGSTNVNHYSTIFSMRFADRVILFTGDAYVVSENRVLDTLPQNIDILDVGHHGSNTSTGQNLLAHTTPTYAIIQVGTATPNTGNSYGHPHAPVVDRLGAAGVTVFTTATHGTVLVRICPTGANLDLSALGNLRG